MADAINQTVATGSSKISWINQTKDNFLMSRLLSVDFYCFWISNRAMIPGFQHISLLIPPAGKLLFNSCCTLESIFTLTRLQLTTPTPLIFVVFLVHAILNSNCRLLYMHCRQPFTWNINWPVFIWWMGLLWQTNKELPT